MTTQRQLAMKPEYSPREFGERLDPPRSGQWVLVRVQGKVPGEAITAKRGVGGWLIPHEELRRLGGQDLTEPGHEGVSSERDELLRSLRHCIAEANAQQAAANASLAQAVRLLSEIEG